MYVYCRGQICNNIFFSKTDWRLPGKFIIIIIVIIILASLPHPLPLTGPISLSTDKPRFFKIMWVRLNAERAIVDMNTDIDRSRWHWSFPLSWMSQSPCWKSRLRQAATPKPVVVHVGRHALYKDIYTATPWCTDDVQHTRNWSTFRRYNSLEKIPRKYYR